MVHPITSNTKSLTLQKLKLKEPQTCCSTHGTARPWRKNVQPKREVQPRNPTTWNPIFTEMIRGKSAFLAAILKGALLDQQSSDKILAPLVNPLRIYLRLELFPSPILLHWA